MSSPKILFVVAHDSQFKWSACAAQGFASAGWQISYFCPSEHADVSQQQIVEAGVDPRQVERGNGAASLADWRRYDVVVFPTPGDITEPYLLALHEAAARAPALPRPLVVCAYVGLVISNHENGIAARASADLICVNSQADWKVFERTVRELGLSADGLALTGLPILPFVFSEAKAGDIRQVVFADQMAIPRLKNQRRYMYSRLLEYAIKYPDRRVVVKPRHRPAESSYKKGAFPPEQYFDGIVLPGNLLLTYTPIVDLLPQTDLMLTISSTAAVEAMAAGCRTALIGDFGFDQGLGNRVFIGSGLIRTFDQILADDFAPPDQGWLRDFYHSDGKGPKEEIFLAIRGRLQELRTGRLPLPDCAYIRARKLLYQMEKNQSEPVRKDEAPKKKKKTKRHWLSMMIKKLRGTKTL